MSKKHQPQEISSNEPVSVLRQVVPVMKKKALDPRFDRNFGHYNKDLFSKSYSFLQDIHQQETAQLEAQLKKERNAENIEKIKSILEKRKNRARAQERVQKDKKLLKHLQREDLKRVEAGVKKPYFLKKSEQKAILYQSRNKEYTENKSEEQIKKSLERKLKKRASKQRRKLPWENQ